MPGKNTAAGSQSYVQCLFFVVEWFSCKLSKLVSVEGEVREIGAFEAKNTLGALLDLVQQGEEIVITRHGKPVARLVKEVRRVDRDQTRRAAASIRELARTVKLGRFEWQEWKADRDAGRP